MKRITILLLGLSIALLAGNVANAKKKAHSNSGSVPSVKIMMDCLYELSGNCDGSMRVTLPAGVKLIEISGSYFAFGKNVTMCKSEAIATGPHAYYVDSEACSDAAANIYFKSKADRDKFWASFKKSRYFFRGCERYTQDGWYCIRFGEGG